MGAVFLSRLPHPPLHLPAYQSDRRQQIARGVAYHEEGVADSGLSIRKQMDEGDGDPEETCIVTPRAASSSDVHRAWAGDKAMPGMSPSVVVVISTVSDRRRRPIALRVPPPAAPPSEGSCSRRLRREDMSKTCSWGTEEGSGCLAVKGHAGEVFRGLESVL